MNNVVSILCMRTDKRCIYGTGFYISNNYILTCSHIFKNISKIFVYVNKKLKRTLIVKILEVADICVLYDIDGNESYYELEFETEFLDDQINVLGKTGIYNNIVNLHGNIIYKNYVSYTNIDGLATNVKISKGFSGSPIVQNGKVIGMMTWFLNNDNGNNLYLSGGPNSRLLKHVIEHDIIYNNNQFSVRGLSLHELFKYNIYESYGEIVLHSNNEYFTKDDIIISIDTNYIGYDHCSSNYYFLQNINKEEYNILLLRQGKYRCISIKNPLFKII